MTVFITLWLGWNIFAPASSRFDPYTFTFLTLLLSLQASYAAPLILLAQGRQTNRDQVSLSEDRRRAEIDTEVSSYITRELADLNIKLNSISIELSSRSGMRRREDEVVDRLAKIESSLGRLVESRP